MSSRNKNRKGVIEAAGGLVWRLSAGSSELALVHRERYDDWSFPKGWLRKTESWQQAALREVAEETGCRAELSDFAGCIWYVVESVPKVVLYWHMELLDLGSLEENDETDKVVWLCGSEALNRLSYDNERALLDRVLKERNKQ